MAVYTEGTVRMTIHTKGYPLQSYYVVVMLGIDYVVGVSKRLDDPTYSQKDS